MAVASLKFRPHTGTPDETKGGFIVYDGNAAEYHHWYFRTTIKVKATKKEDIPRTTSQIIESPRGDALQCAVDMGQDELMKMVLG